MRQLELHNSYFILISALESELKYNWNVFEYMELMSDFFQMLLTSPDSSFYQIDRALLPLILLWSFLLLLVSKLVP